MDGGKAENKFALLEFTVLTESSYGVVGVVWDGLLLQYSCVNHLLLCLFITCTLKFLSCMKCKFVHEGYSFVPRSGLKMRLHAQNKAVQQTSTTTSV